MLGGDDKEEYKRSTGDAITEHMRSDFGPSLAIPPNQFKPPTLPCQDYGN